MEREAGGTIGDLSGDVVGGGAGVKPVVGGPLGGVLVVAAGDIDGSVAHHGQQPGRQLLASVVKRNPGP